MRTSREAKIRVTKIKLRIESHLGDPEAGLTAAVEEDLEAATEVVMVALEETEVADLAVDSVAVEEAGVTVEAALTHVNPKVHQEQSQKTSKSSQTISKSSASQIGLCINITLISSQQLNQNDFE